MISKFSWLATAILKSDGTIDLFRPSEDSFHGYGFRVRLASSLDLIVNSFILQASIKDGMSYKEQ